MSASKNGEVLVYIPCHTDFVEALSQAKRLRADFQIYSNAANTQFKKLTIILSVNSFIPSISESNLASSLCDEVICFGDVLLADVNISQGFLVALRRQPEIFWMLSTNDLLAPGALTRVLSEFETDSNLDVVITNPKLESFKGILERIDSVNGVISGVIYRTKNFIQFFNVAPFFPWTGWSHLTVVHAALKFHGTLNALFINQQSVFTQTEKTIKANGSTYAHSFTGDLIQKFLFCKNDVERRSVLRNFVRTNYFRIHLYSERDKQNHDKSLLITSEHYLSWNSLISESLLKSYTPVTYVAYKILKKIPFENFVANKLIRIIKSKLQSH
jgi:hypothetical protein